MQCYKCRVCQCQERSHVRLHGVRPLCMRQRRSDAAGRWPGCRRLSVTTACKGGCALWLLFRGSGAGEDQGRQLICLLAWWGPDNIFVFLFFCSHACSRDMMNMKLVGWQGLAGPQQQAGRGVPPSRVLLPAVAPCPTGWAAGRPHVDGGCEHACWPAREEGTWKQEAIMCVAALFNRQET